MTLICSMTENNSPQTGRRNALKVIGAGMLTATSPLVGSTAASSDKAVVISIQRDQDNGIGMKEYAELCSRFSAAAKEKAGLDELAIAKPELSTGEEIFSLTFVAIPDGKVQTYIGSATNPGKNELKRLHDRSLRVQKQQSIETADGELSTQQSDPSYEWNQVGSALWEKTDYPHGIVQNSSEAWRYPDDPNFDVYAATVDAAFEPGYAAYGSNWIWTNLSGRHYWGRNYEPGGANLTDWAPSGDRSGSTTVNASVSYSGASIGVSYTPPEVNRTDNTGLSNDNVRIQWEPGQESSREDIFSPSVASVNKADNSASVGDNLAQTSARMTVMDIPDTKTISTPLTLQYES